MKIEMLTESRVRRVCTLNPGGQRHDRTLAIRRNYLATTLTQTNNGRARGMRYRMITMSQIQCSLPQPMCIAPTPIPLIPNILVNLLKHQVKATLKQWHKQRYRILHRYDLHQLVVMANLLNVRRC